MKKKYRNTAFLVELLINILVFSVSCAILVGLFGKAGEITRRNREKSFASNQVLSLVETVKALGPDGLAGAERVSDEELLCRFDADWQATGDAGAPYHVRLRIVPESRPGGVLRRVSVVAETADGREIYSLDTASYHPAQRGGSDL